MRGVSMPVLEPTQDWLNYVLDTIDEGIHAVDLTGDTIVYNAAAGRLDGLSPKDVMGKHVLSAFPSLEHETSTLLQVLQTGSAIHNQPQSYTNYLGVKVHTVNTTLPILSAGRVVGALEVSKDLTQVKRLSEQVLDLQALVAGGQRKRKPAGVTHPAAVYRFSHILSEDAQMEEMKRRAARAAQTSSPILVFGETGTGKELLVQAVHNASPRQGQPFMALNCAALPASLLEGLLFGTVRGSFTGADDRPGLFEIADDGTLFLDEIQSMPLDLQAKLLRVLQEGEVMRLGDSRVRRLNVRVVAAMNERPETALNNGTLRPDLYYRINVVRFDIPPLRNRPHDLQLLTRHFIEKWNGRFGANVLGVTEDVAELFVTYPWPGNVRELENAIEAAMNLVSEGEIPLDALPLHLREWAIRQANQQIGADTRPHGNEYAEEYAEKSAYSSAYSEAERNQSASANPYLEWADVLVTEGMNEFWAGIAHASAARVDWAPLQVAFEKMVIQRALQACKGNVKQTAIVLGMPRQTLQYRIKQLGL